MTSAKSSLIDKTIRRALLADNDIATLSDIAGTRRLLKSAGIDFHQVTISAQPPALDNIAALRIIRAAEVEAENAKQKLAVAERTIAKLEAEAEQVYALRERIEEGNRREALLRQKLNIFERDDVLNIAWDHDFGIVLGALTYGDMLDPNDLHFDFDEVLAAMRREKLITQRCKVTRAGHAWRPDNILTRYSELEAEVEALRAAKKGRAVNHALTVTEWVRRTTYTPAQAQAEKDRIDAGVADGKIAFKRAAKHKAWVTRRTNKP